MHDEMAGFNEVRETRLCTVRAQQCALGLQQQAGIKAAPTTKQGQGPVQTGGGGDGSDDHAAGEPDGGERRFCRRR
jgi:hypothetical protein